MKFTCKVNVLTNEFSTISKFVDENEDDDDVDNAGEVDNDDHELFLHNNKNWFLKNKENLFKKKKNDHHIIQLFIKLSLIIDHWIIFIIKG